MTRGKVFVWWLNLMMLLGALIVAGCESAAIMPSEAPRYAVQTAAPAAVGGVPGGLGTGGELWIVPLDEVQRSTRPATAPAEQGMPLPGSPTLAARQSDGKLVPVPLKHTDVSATISGCIASVGVMQQFANPYAEKIEAVYMFPLPENAAVNDFVMTIGERHIRGIIRERTEAEKIYRAARAQGYVASLMMQERPNIFTQNVANIEPGKRIDIDIRYFHTLTYRDGWFEWVFPMVVGPRYNPADSTDGMGSVARDVRGMSGQKTEVRYLQPEERSGRDISLRVQLDAGMKIEELASVNHKVRLLENRTVVQLDPTDALPNKDFVLRYRVAGDRVKSALFVQKDKGGGSGYFALMVVPPTDLASLPRRPVEMAFVVDTSGSMSGQPIAQAKAAVNAALTRMDPTDTFQIVKCNSSAGQMSPAPLAASADNIAMARRYVAHMEGGGGAEMLNGMKAALDVPHDPARTRVVVFLSDGYIGSEAEVLRILHDPLFNARLFSLGVGASPNRHLLDAMARLGHGDVAYLSLGEPAQPVMEQYFQRISHPAMANVKVDFSGMKVTDVFPQRIPELFVGRPIIITGRFTGAPAGDIVVSGNVGDRKLTFSLPAGTAVEENPAIASVWAQMRIADLYDEAICDGRDVVKDVRETALAYGLMSEFTSFIAVDSTQQTAGDHGTTVAVPIPVPEGVRYGTATQETPTRREN